MKKIFRRLTALLLVISIVFSLNIIQVQAASMSAYSVLSNSKPAKTYTISTGKTIPYTSSSLTVRGSVTYGASKTAWIGGTDELYVYKVGTAGNGKAYAYVSYPISSTKRAYAYIPLSVITANNGSHSMTTSTGKFNVAIRAGGKTNSKYYVSRNDTVYLLATSGNNYQILYPCAGGYRIGWTTKATYNKYCKSIAVTSISLSKSSVSLSGKGATYTLTAYINPSNASNKSVTWTSSNKSVATVSSSGKITAVGAGTATITCKSSNGKTATCKVTVTIPKVSNTYSINNNVLTLLGVKMNEYKIGSTFENGYYANVNGKRVYLGAKQCYGYACYIEMKLFGCCAHNARAHFPNLAGSEKVTPKNTSDLKKLITAAGVGAHIRTGANIYGGKHSMIIIGITSNGFTVVDANAKGDNKIAVRTYTWSSYLSSNYGKQGFWFIEVHK